MERENPFNADPVGDLPHSEGGPNPSPFPTDDHSFEGLYSFLLSLYDLHVDPYRISHPEIRKICPELLSLNQFHRIHVNSPSKNSMKLLVASFMFQDFYFNSKPVTCNLKLIEILPCPIT